MAATTSKTYRRTALALATSLTLALGLVVPVQQAQAFVFFDPTNFFANLGGWVEDIYEYGTEAKRWSDTAQQYKNEYDSFMAQIAQITNIAYSLGIKPGQKLDRIPEDHGVADRCGENAMAALGRLITLNPSGNIVNQQKQICASIQIMQNKKYNETVAFLADNQKEMIKDFDQFKQQANKAKNIGDSNKAAQDGVSLTSKLQSRISNYQTQMQAYDAYIATLTNQQQNLARIAMKGKAGVVGTLVKTATLKTALNIGD